MPCKVGIVWGKELTKYSFPEHPMNVARLSLIEGKLAELLKEGDAIEVKPVQASDDQLLSFHTPIYVKRVREASLEGKGYLDYGDTPAYKGVFEAASYVVGSTLRLVRLVASGKIEHGFNPAGGLHHAMPDSAAGFCVFNDAAIAINEAKKLGYERILYVDIDAHHGDGIYYPFESVPWLHVVDIHEDPRYLYPGTGFEYEVGRGDAKGAKLNIPLPPWSGDKEFSEAFTRAFEFCRSSDPDFIFLQAGADSMDGDPLTHLKYSERSHLLATSKLHTLAHEVCKGRIVVMGGGGYNTNNIARAWSTVLKELIRGSAKERL